MLAHPGQRIHVTELITAVDGAAPDARSSATALDDGLEVASLDETDYLIDSRARAEYASRLRELRAELDEADNFNDMGRSERLRSEIDLISDELTASTGRGSRRGSPVVERVRVMVGKNIRSALEKIRREAPELGAHLTRSISTGYYCTYQPIADQPIAWRL
jgi:non-specific serine/threonine protein kinase